MLDQLVVGQLTIQAALADYANADPTVREQLRAQLSTIAGLRQQIGTASIATLGALQAQVLSIVSTASAASHDAQASALAGSSSPVGMASFAAREQTVAVMAGMKDFDADLKFADARDEAQYREREAERRAYIAAQQAKGTPQRDLNAAGGAVGQMADAAAHGAAKNPEFQQRWDKLTASTEALRTELVREGKDVSEFDRHLRDDLRRIMKAKGLSDTQIDAQFSAHSNPLEAAKAYVATADIQIIQSAARDATATGKTDSVIPAKAPDEPLPPLADAIATLRAAGVVAGPESTDTTPKHGVTAQAASASAARQIG